MFRALDDVADAGGALGVYQPRGESTAYRPDVIAFRPDAMALPDAIAAESMDPDLGARCSVLGARCSVR
ncbi:hypothetical protein [Nocardia abscessus]|uniref:hypothetical protein n=1 Tax=Nocardia abscessus TaxID=120957 RepID=UPI00189344F9|nr:hypothetical protein [Nocardia abscessus]